jgi:hypothetical protein
VLYVLALPGILLIALSILLLLVSILALLLLTAPAYLVLYSLVGGGIAEQQGSIVIEPARAPGEQGRRRVEATVVDPPE